MHPLYVWLIVISIIACGITVKDKRAARKKRRRTPEKTLFFIALIGGSAAMFLTMLAIRHKTQKTAFMLGIPCILFLQAVLLSWLSVYL